MTREKAFELITKLLATASDKGASENEAITAALKAQELMAKYQIDIAEVQTEDKEEIVRVGYSTGTGNKWKLTLALIVAKNFCCKVYTENREFVIFYGYKHNAEIACEVFKFLFNAGNRFANRYYMNNRNHGEVTKGIKNTFLVGFVAGIKSVLEKQCTALMLVVPEEVKKSYEDMSKGFKSVSTGVRYNGTETNAYREGVTTGRDVAQSRYIEG